MPDCIRWQREPNTLKLLRNAFEQSLIPHWQECMAFAGAWLKLLRLALALEVARAAAGAGPDGRGASVPQ